MHITVSQTINAPQDRVFAVATDIPNAAAFIGGIDDVQTLAEAPPHPDNLGPVGEGYTWRETRTMFGKKATEDMTITEWSPPSGYAVEARSHGSRYRSTFAIEPTTPGSTTITMAFTATPETFGAKIMMKLFSAMSKKLVKCLEDDLRDIKAAAESR